ncbi:MAG: isoprenylcysteine carboxylmethyltransferase family protein [Vicinamibacterales bacterium]|jgi:protein-S-isoprenylcysteine O-methyltransferase Ste14|nr:isoprenylcysteine carboxylmethyltransferase family protein [Vicinamibacterales bacterium]MDP7477683.1 isoprenylcysteine carboxylmethyltransferase family protein [Vicinamibacterales bacterium]MDP7671497.1 isoprenylcysteine carboxylmethyltransferase family protein [Vicinamibacterales bacterium]HJO39428.1 isoprenylcysteine carboxylmethyltransferase family protein [Vicinamibacterales bacterium]|tara:strand:- start:3401 stop:3946 length:546 start_codon:yes stop_codon:yes gene_type:complete
MTSGGGEPASFLARIAGLRVPLGFVVGVVTIASARPSSLSLMLGLPIALVGELIRVWAAGHLEKGREVTTSGPYRWVRHPLYVGSAVLGVGFATATGSPIIAVVVAAYFGLTLTSAIKAEEAELQDRFGGTYDAYRNGELGEPGRRFSLARALRNREHKAAAGVVLVGVLLWLRVISESGG